MLSLDWPNMFVKWVERRISNRVWRGSLRMIFNPARALANVATQRPPWDRPIGWKWARRGSGAATVEVAIFLVAVAAGA